MLLRQCILAINGIIITFTLSLSEVTLICENRQKYAHFENLICEKNLALGGSVREDFYFNSQFLMCGLLLTSRTPLERMPSTTLTTS